MSNFRKAEFHEAHLFGECILQGLVELGLPS
jgi:hypothetical protein